MAGHVWLLPDFVHCLLDSYGFGGIGVGAFKLAIKKGWLEPSVPPTRREHIIFDIETSSFQTDESCNWGPIVLQQVHCIRQSRVLLEVLQVQFILFSSTIGQVITTTPHSFALQFQNYHAVSESCKFSM